MKGKKPVTEGEMLHDSPFRRYRKQSDSEKQSVRWWLTGGGCYLVGVRSQAGGPVSSGGPLCNTAPVLNKTVLRT